MGKIVDITNRFSEKNTTETSTQNNDLLLKNLAKGFSRNLEEGIVSVNLSKTFDSMPEILITYLLDDLEIQNLKLAKLGWIILSDTSYNNRLSLYAKEKLKKFDSFELTKIRNSLYSAKKLIFQECYVSKNKFGGIIAVCIILRDVISEEYYLEIFHINYPDTGFTNYFVFSSISYNYILNLVKETFEGSIYTKINENMLNYLLQERINYHNKSNVPISPSFEKILKKYNSSEAKISLIEKKSLSNSLFESVDTPQKAINGFFHSLLNKDDSALEYLFDYQPIAKNIVKKYKTFDLTLSDILEVNIEGNIANATATLIYKSKSKSLMKTSFIINLISIEGNWKISGIEETTMLIVESDFFDKLLDMKTYVKVYTHNNNFEISTFLGTALDEFAISSKCKQTYILPHTNNILTQNIITYDLFANMFIVSNNEFAYITSNKDDINEMESFVENSLFGNMLYPIKTITISRKLFRDYTASKFSSLLTFLYENLIMTPKDYRKLKNAELTNLDFYFFKLLTLTSDTMSEYGVARGTIKKTLKAIYKLLNHFYSDHIENGSLDDLNKKVDLRKKLDKMINVRSLPNAIKDDVMSNYLHLRTVDIIQTYIINEFRKYEKYHDIAHDMSLDIFSIVIDFIISDCYDKNDNKCMKTFNQHSFNELFNK